jgi:hypothetical protein
MSSQKLRAMLTFWIALAGMLIVFGSLLLAVLVFQDAKNPASTIVAVVGAVTGVIGTLAGYVAGQAAGSAGKEQAEARATHAQEEAATAQRQLGTVAGAAGEDAVAQARKIFPEWWGEVGSSAEAGASASEGSDETRSTGGQ